MDPLRRELALQDALVRAVRRDLYSIDPRYRRSRATTALAAAVAERTYQVIAERPDLHNEASEEWRGHLQRVWLWLAGDEQQHYPLSNAVADFLRSPLNHVEGQDGPDDMDRPHTVAAFAAVSSALFYGVDFAEDALAGLFEALDLKYDQEFVPARNDEFDALSREVAARAALLREALAEDNTLNDDLLAALRA